MISKIFKLFLLISFISGTGQAQKNVHSANENKGRSVTYRNIAPILKNASHLSGKLIYKICVNRLGEVIKAILIESETTIYDQDVLDAAIDAVYGYRYTPDPYAPKEECGKLSIKIDNFSGFHGSSNSKKSSTNHPLGKHETIDYIMHRSVDLEKINIDLDGGMQVNDYTIAPKDIEIVSLNSKYIKLACKTGRCITHKSKSINRAEDDLVMEYKGKIELKENYLKAWKHLQDKAIKRYENDLFLKTIDDPFSTPTQIDSPSNESIPLTKNGNLYELCISINNALKTKIILDTGASDVLLSPDVLLALERSGTISEKDYIGSSDYFTAGGDLITCQKYILKSISIGERKIENVSCAISDRYIEHMLLGQSFLQKLGSYKIDYENDVLLLE